MAASEAASWQAAALAVGFPGHCQRQHHRRFRPCCLRDASARAPSATGRPVARLCYSPPEPAAPCAAAAAALRHAAQLTGRPRLASAASACPRLAACDRSARAASSRWRARSRPSGCYRGPRRDRRASPWRGPTRMPTCLCVERAESQAQSQPRASGQRQAAERCQGTSCLTAACRLVRRERRHPCHWPKGDPERSRSRSHLRGHH